MQSNESLLDDCNDCEAGILFGQIQHSGEEDMSDGDSDFTVTPFECMEAESGDEPLKSMCESMDEWESYKNVEDISHLKIHSFPLRTTPDHFPKSTLPSLTS